MVVLRITSSDPDTYARGLPKPPRTFGAGLSSLRSDILEGWSYPSKNPLRAPRAGLFLFDRSLKQASVALKAKKPAHCAGFFACALY